MRNDGQIATVFLRPAESYSVITTPGRKLNFNNGRADILAQGDLEFVLGMPNAVIYPEPRFLDAVADTILKRESTKAQVDSGSGPGPAGSWALHTTALARLAAQIAIEQAEAEEAAAREPLPEADPDEIINALRAQLAAAEASKALLEAWNPAEEEQHVVHRGRPRKEAGAATA